MKIVQRPATAAVAVGLGLIVVVLGASLVMLRDGGWPWHATISDSAGAGPATVEILDEDGAAYRFTGSPAEARTWLDHKQDELKVVHDIPTKIAVGKVLRPIGLALVVVGLARLLWWLTTLRRSRGTA